MTVVEKVVRLLGGSNTGPTVAVYCPLSEENTDATRIATGGTEPDAWDAHEQIAVYECGVCGNRHRFLWGPPAPLYLGDSPGGPDSPDSPDSPDTGGEVA